MTIVDTPGLVDPGIANNVIDNDVYQWFIDRSDVIYIVLDVTQLQLSTGLKLLIEQLKGNLILLVFYNYDPSYQWWYLSDRPRCSFHIE